MKNARKSLLPREKKEENSVSEERKNGKDKKKKPVLQRKSKGSEKRREGVSGKKSSLNASKLTHILSRSMHVSNLYITVQRMRKEISLLMEMKKRKVM